MRYGSYVGSIYSLKMLKVFQVTLEQPFGFLQICGAVPLPSPNWLNVVEIHLTRSDLVRQAAARRTSLGPSTVCDMRFG